MSRTGPDEYTCRQVAKVLQSYLDGEVEADVARRVANHVEKCVNCGYEAETLRRICESIARQSPPLDTEAVDRIRRFGEDLAHGEV